MSAPTPELPSQYDPKVTEPKWQQYWQEQEVFKADPTKSGETYSIVIPPPNVTGSLHIGHAFNTALIDTLVRYHRMTGKNTLCLPGTDHASIAVQTILEKQLKEEKSDRYTLGREKFLERAWAWKAESGGKIVNQLQRLGLSADWSRQRFTLDDKLCDAVKTAFVKLYEEGLIYRGNYLVNWCPESQSAVSDLEVDNKEVNGNLWHFRYPLTDGSGYVEVATTRPETMLGDTGVAVNPNDDRYQALIGKTVTLPIVGREIPIFADELVDPTFGTGCVKVTPAHDPNDFEMGKRHNLPFINIMNKDGTLNEEAGPFIGQDRFVARKNLIKQLEANGVLIKTEDYVHSVPYSERGKVPVEPLLSTQWFVKIESLAQRALTDLDQHNSPDIVPDRWQKVYRDWLVKINDWCISRQLWWGHQIPAWYVVSETNGEIKDDTPFVVAHDAKEAELKAKIKYGANIILEQDPDVLDTWFSSGLWPFSTLGWPEETDDLATYYPNSVLVTGFDIIFFWVARMTMMAGHFTDRMPFKDVYIHGLVRDENGKKMSKSANNGIDPLMLVDKYGSDAVRYTLIREVAGAGQDISLQYDRATDESQSVEASRNFANKLWNASRFAMMNLGGQTPKALGLPNPAYLELSDRWILSRFYQTVQQTRTQIESYGLGEAAKGLYEFIWGDFCDWYIELVKNRIKDETNPRSAKVAQQTLAYVLEGILKLLHPFMPHITEELWHTLTQAQGSLAVAPYPSVDEILSQVVNAKLDTTVIVASPTTTSSLQTVKAPAKTTKDHNSEIRMFLDQVADYLTNLPTWVSSFLLRNQRGLTVLAIAGGTVVTLEILTVIVRGIESLWLISTLIQGVGVGYAGWLLYKYILFSDDRSQTFHRLDRVWQEVKGVYEDQQEALLDASQPPTPVLASSSETAAPAYALPPVTTLVNPAIEQEFELLFATIRVIRNLRAEADIKPGLKIPVILQTFSPGELETLNSGASYIQELAKVEQLTLVNQLDQIPAQAIAGVVGTVQVLIPLTGIVDLEALKAKLQRKLDKLEQEIKSLTGRLNNSNFVAKASPEIVQGARDNLAEVQQQQRTLQDRLQGLS